MVVALEKIAVAVENLTRAFDVGLVPVCFYLGPVWESNDPKAIFLAIYKVALIQRAVGVMILPFAILFALTPHTLINIPIRVFHPPLAMLHIIPPFSLINIPIRIAVPSIPLFPVPHYSLVTLSIPEEIIPLNQGVILPCAEVYISVVVDVYAEVVALSVGVQLAVVETAVEILFFDEIGQGLQLCDVFLEFWEEGSVVSDLVEELFAGDVDFCDFWVGDFLLVLG